MLSDPAFCLEAWKRYGAAGVFAKLVAAGRFARWLGPAASRDKVAAASGEAKVLVALPDGRVLAHSRTYCMAEADPLCLASSTRAATARRPPLQWPTSAEEVCHCASPLQ